MANFAINQVRHFYVASSTNTVTPVGNKKSFKLKYKSPGGEVCSDIIDADKILYANYTPAAKIGHKLKSLEITVGTPVIGQDYALKVIYRNCLGAGDDATVVKYAMATAKDTTAANLATALVDSLKKNLKDIVASDKLASAVSSSGAKITISEIEQPWKVGVKPYAVMDFEVEILPIVKDGVESTAWATVAEKKTVASNVAAGSNGKMIADLEWFHVGARGDYYRGFGHPHGVKTELVADPSVSYDTIDIHYAYVGPNEGAQKSEKTITIAGTTSQLTAVLDALLELGFNFKKADGSAVTDSNSNATVPDAAIATEDALKAL